jgi:hypothetical protein
MPDREEFPSQIIMRNIYYMIFPLHHAASDQEGNQSQGEGQLSPETVAYLAE